MTFAAVIILVYPFLFIFQGLDFTDTGFAASNYQMVFSHPGSISYWGFNYWLTDIIGGLWLKAFGWLGLLGLHAAAAVCIVLTSFLVYLILRPHVRPWILFIGLLTSETVIERMYWLNYDNLTALFYLLTACLLLYSMLRTRYSYVFALLGGIAMGLTAFLRLTNVTDISLLLLFPAGALLRQKGWGRALFNLLLALIGAVGTTFLLLAYMKSSGQYDLFMQNFQTLFSIAGGHGNTHSGSYLLAHMQKDELYALRAGGWVIVAIAALALVNRTLGRALGLIVLALAAVAGVVFLWPHFSVRYDFVVGLTGVLYALLIVGVILYAKRNPQMSLISLTALILLFAEPIGSDLILLIATYGMYLAIPLAAQIFQDVLPHKWLGQASALIGLAVLLVAGAITGYHYTYRDSSNRSAMSYTVGKPLLGGIYTTKDRATVVRQLLDVMPRYVRPGEPLLAYEETSLVYYLTDTVPYLGSSWPMLYDPVAMKTILEEKNAQGGPWPAVVRAKGETADFGWPNVDHLRLDYRHNEDRAFIAQFLRQHGYSVVWQNQFFQILLPAKR